MSTICSAAEAPLTRPVILVGNKTDLESQRVIATHQGEALAQQQGWMFFETSAKERINVDVVFREITRLIRDNDGSCTKKKAKG